jgi:hypothetical protein
VTDGRSDRASERFELVVGPASDWQKLGIRVLRLAAWVLDGSDADDSQQKVEVRDRATGEVVFEDTSGGRGMEDLLRSDLDRLSTSEFLDRWGLNLPGRA